MNRRPDRMPVAALATAAAAAVVALGMILWACAAPPTEEMDKAREAVSRAERDKNAAAYAVPGVTRARDLLALMEAEAEAKRYESAKTYAADAIAAAEKAILDGAAGAARARDDAAGLLRELEPELAEAEKSVGAAREAENLVVDFAALDRDLDFARKAFGEASACFAAEDYAGTAAQAQPIRPALASIRNRLANAAQAVTRKK